MAESAPIKSRFWKRCSASPPQTRARQIRLFTAYGAPVKIVYLETGWAERMRRNAGRRHSVPEIAISRMLEKLTPPERWEARSVQWHCG